MWILGGTRKRLEGHGTGIPSATFARMPARIADRAVGRYALQAAVCLLVLIAAGCGGGSGQTTDHNATAAIERAPLKKQQLIARADRICETSSWAVVAERERFDSARGIDPNHRTLGQEEQEVARIIVPAVRKQIEKLETLGSPAGESATVDRIWHAMSTAADDSEAMPWRLVKEGVVSPFHRARALAGRYGFVVCGQG